MVIEHSHINTFKQPLQCHWSKANKNTFIPNNQQQWTFITVIWGYPQQSGYPQQELRPSTAQPRIWRFHDTSTTVRDVSATNPQKNHPGKAQCRAFRPSAIKTHKQRLLPCHSQLWSQEGTSSLVLRCPLDIFVKRSKRVKHKSSHNSCEWL